MQTKQPKVILLDTEFFHINWGADLGLLFCMSWKELNKGKVHTESVWATNQKDALDDKELCRNIFNVIKDADMVITYNGIKCDMPFIQTRMLRNGLGVLPPIAHKDLYYTAKFKLKLSRSGLKNVQDFLELDTHKTPVRLYQWLKALIGNRAAQREIITHCEHDVLVLEECYNQLMPLMLSHPRLHGFGPCNKCGGKVESRGTYITAGKKNKRRVHCTSCGGWETRDEVKSK